MDVDSQSNPTDAVTLAIKSLAARCRQLDADAARLEGHIDTITATAAPKLRAVYGVGPDTVAILLTAIGDNPGPDQQRRDRESGKRKLIDGPRDRKQREEAQKMFKQFLPPGQNPQTPGR